MTHAHFWAGVFPGHGKRCAAALRSTPLEQYPHFGIFRVRCAECGFDQRAGVAVDPGEDLAPHVEWTESTRVRPGTTAIVWGPAVAPAKGKKE